MHLHPGGRQLRESLIVLLVTATSAGLMACTTPEPDVANSSTIDTATRAGLLAAPDSVRDTVIITDSLTAGLPVSESEVSYLLSRRLLIPVPGVGPDDLPDTFDEARSEGRRHDAIDILAARGTAVLSVDDGRIAKIDTSARGGLSLYTTDPSGRFVYYYAHLDRYRDGLRNGLAVRRGDTVGFVGTTGNAPPNTPHLHFAINRLDDPRRWWDGTPINPRPLLLLER